MLFWREVAFWMIEAMASYAGGASVGIGTGGGEGGALRDTSEFAGSFSSDMSSDEYGVKVLDDHHLAAWWLT